jgi:hypothetical protein
VNTRNRRLINGVKVDRLMPSRWIAGMKRLMMMIMLIAANPVHASERAVVKDNNPQDCAKQNFDGEEEHYRLREGVRATLKMQRENDRLAKQGKLCGDYWGDEFCRAKSKRKK